MLHRQDRGLVDEADTQSAGIEPAERVRLGVPVEVQPETGQELAGKRRRAVQVAVEPQEGVLQTSKGGPVRPGQDQDAVSEGDMPGAQEPSVGGGGQRVPLDRLEQLRADQHRAGSG